MVTPGHISVAINTGGGYIASTFVPAAVVEAFGVASGVLAGFGSAAAAAGSAVSLPVVAGVAGVAALAVVAAGGYCYFNGIPAPIEAGLSSAGLGAATKQGFAVSVPQLAVSLIALGAAGYIAYQFYENFRSIRAARLRGSAPDVQSREDAEATVRSAFGEQAWAAVGSSIWSSVEDAGRAATVTAQEAINGSVALAQRLAAAASHAAVAAKGALAATAASAADAAASVGNSGHAAFRGAADASADVAERATGLFAKMMRLFRRAS